MSAICEEIASYLEHLATHGYAKSTITARRYHLAGLSEFLADRDVSDIEAVTPALLSSYQRHLFLHRSAGNAALLPHPSATPDRDEGLLRPPRRRGDDPL